MNKIFEALGELGNSKVKNEFPKYKRKKRTLDTMKFFERQKIRDQKNNKINS